MDASGGPVFDPTANVLDLVEKETKRQDDLRAMGDRLAEAETRRINAELGCIKEIMKLRARHYREREVSEAARLDSVRQVDKTTFDTTVAEIRTAVKALADVTTSTASTLQARVDQTAATLAKAGSDQVAEVMKRIAALELSAAQGLGKQAVVDPQMEQLKSVVEMLARSGEKRTGKGEGIGAVWAAILGAALFVSTMFGIVGVIYAVLKP